MGEIPPSMPLPRAGYIIMHHHSHRSGNAAIRFQQAGILIRAGAVEDDQGAALEQEHVQLDAVGTRQRRVDEGARRVLKGGVGRPPVTDDLDRPRFPLHPGDVLRLFLVREVRNNWTTTAVCGEQ